MLHILWAAKCTPYEGLDGMLLERNWKLTMWTSKSSGLSYSLVESLPPHKYLISRLSYSLVESLPPQIYLMPVMIDFFLIRWRCRVIKPQLSMKQHTSWCYNDRKSIIFALSATLASFCRMTCFIHNETAITFVWKNVKSARGCSIFPPWEKVFSSKVRPSGSKSLSVSRGLPALRILVETIDRCITSKVRGKVLLSKLI